MLGRNSAMTRSETDGNIEALKDFHNLKIRQLVPGPLPLSKEAKAIHPAPVHPEVPSLVLYQIRQLISDSAAIEMYLKRFRSLSTYFPFVGLPENWTAQSLISSRPFLVFGILCATCRNNPLLHYRLDIEFKKALSDRVLVRGEASLDLLQGMLVYIAWWVPALYT
jgi:hypothetical protein